MSAERVLLTGATGLVGGAVLARLLDLRRDVKAIALVRDPSGAARLLARLGPNAARVELLRGDITLPGLGLDGARLAALSRQLTHVVHAAADTSFAQTPEQADRVNVAGTRHVVELAEAAGARCRLTFVSTAFVAGRRTGVIAEDAGDGDGAGFVNEYERSKHEAERIARASAAAWTIARSSTVVCDSARGEVTQMNAVHRALRLYRAGLAPMMPGTDASPVDVVTTDFVADGIARLATMDAAVRETVHLCAGAGSLALGALLDLSWSCWARDDEWRRRGIPRPALTNLETYRLFEETVEDTGDRRLKQVVRSLSHFVPQLALPKTFDTANAERLLGAAAPAVGTFWTRMVGRLDAWRHGAREAA